MMEVRAEAGENLYSLIRRASAAACERSTTVEMIFNDTRVRVYAGSHEYDIADKWAMQRRLNDAKR